MFSLLFFLCNANSGAGYNDFPSFITENTTMAVFIDKEFFNDVVQYEYYLLEIPNIIKKITRIYMHLTYISDYILQDLNINLRHDYMILLTVTNCEKTWLTFTKAQKEELVYIAVTDSDCPRLPKEESISIPIIEPGLELPQILLDLRMNNIISWTKINVILENSSDDETINKILRALSIELPDKKIQLTSNSLFTIKQEKNATLMKQEVTQILENFQVEQLGHCFMVIATVDIVKNVMEVAKLLKLVHPDNQWLYIIRDSSKEQANMTYFSGMSVEGENVAFIYNVTSLNDKCNITLTCCINKLIRTVAIAIEKSASNEMELYQQVTDDEFNAFRLTKSERKSKIMRKVYKELFKNSAVVDNCGSCLSWQITSTVTWGNSLINNTEIETFLDTGTWNADIGTNMWNVFFPHLSQGFRGRTLPIVTYHNPPWQIIKITDAGEKKYSGLIFDIINYLSLKMNFTYNVSVSITDEKKNIFNNNRMDSSYLKLDNAAMSVAQKIPEEVSKLVVEKKVFLAACASSMLQKSVNGINFTLPISVQFYGLLAPNPAILSRALLFIAPYTAEAWACVAFSIIIFGPLLYVVQKCGLHILRNEHEPSGLNTLWQCIWYIYGALLQQGGMNLPKLSSGRIIVGIWWLGVMVLVATYSAALFAFLTFPRMDIAISSIDDLLARKDEFTWGFPNGSIVEEYLESLNDDKHKEFLRRAERHNTSNVLDIVARIKGKQHVLIDWTSSLRFLMRTDFIKTQQCLFTLSSTEFINEPISLLVPQDSPYLHIINKELKYMHENGLIKKWTANRMPVKDQCWEGRIINPEATKHKVNMGDMQGIFFVLAIGFTFAVIFICCECCWHGRKKARERDLVRPFTN